MDFKPMDFKEAFREALLNSFQDDGDGVSKFSVDDFLRIWFRDMSRSFLFLFKKNLSLTDIQYGELLALLRCHTQNTDKQAVDSLHFLTSEEFKFGLENIIIKIHATFPDKIEFVEFVIENYSSILRPVVIVEPSRGTCTVYIPPHYEIDLYAICAESGYIHSCGYNVYMELLEKSAEIDLQASIRSHLDKFQKVKTPVFLCAYAHEDFTDYDREVASDLKGGLDDVKIYIEKYYLNNQRLVSVLKNLKKYFLHELVIPDPGDYRRALKVAKEERGIDSSHTLWLIIDESISRDNTDTENKKYIICYDQRYKNENPFHIFNENKPAWVAHTTIPHTLAGAMINITRPWWPKNSTVKISDPFCGTGTFWMEAMKFPNVQLECSDFEPIGKLLGDDNLVFFTMSREDIDDVLQQLVLLMGWLKGENPYGSKHIINKYEWAEARYNSLQGDVEDADFEFTEEFIIEITKETPLHRLVFYLMLRTHIRHIGGFTRESEGWNAAMVKETKTLFNQIERLRELKNKEINEVPRENLSECFNLFQSDYSIGCSINVQKCRVLLGDSITICQKDACFIDSEGAYDLIVTDPPYGFNTDDGYGNLARVYAKSIRNMIRSLKDGGQLVMSLPERSHTGRNIPAFATKDWLTLQIISEAQEMNFHAIKQAQVLPFWDKMFRPPYFWQSDRALRRSILHFRFRKQNHNCIESSANCF